MPKNVSDNDPSGWSASQLIDALRRRQKVFRLAKDALEVLFQARGGGSVAYGLAAASAVGVLADAVFPPLDPWEALPALGMRCRNTVLTPFVGHTLLRRGDGEVIASEEKERALVWRNEAGAPLVGLLTGALVELYVHPEGGAELLAELLRHVWDAGRELTIARNVVGNNVNLHVVPMAEPGPYIGRQGPEWYADRLLRYPPGPRTVLLRGRSGVGKSVLARHVCRIVGGDDYRLLKVPSSVLAQCRPDEVLDLLLTLRPTMLLIDDVDFSPSQLTHHLALFETLRTAPMLVFVTLMTDEEADVEPAPGAFYHSGMRPGRIDEIHHIPLPNLEERERLLTFYASRYWPSTPPAFLDLLPELSQRTEGLSGAYLASLVERIATHGLDSWEVELNQVLWASPSPKDDDED